MRHATSKRWLVALGAFLVASAALAALHGNAEAAKGKGKDKGPKGAKGFDPSVPFRTVQGTVSDFTTAPKGEVDGANLSDGTWIHWPPHMADRFTDVVRKGDRVKVTGQDQPDRRRDTKLEVSVLTNLRTGRVCRNEDLPAPGPAANAGPGSVEQRLQALEDRLDQLVQEMRRGKGKK